MKYLILVLFLSSLNVLRLTVKTKPAYVYFNIDNRQISLEFFDSIDSNAIKIDSFEIKKLASKRFFNKLNDTIFIDYDRKPYFNTSLTRYFATRMKILYNRIGVVSTVETLGFLVNKNGEIIYKGFLNDCNDNLYKKEIIDILDGFNLKGRAAIVNHRNVSCLYFFTLDFYSPEFLKYNRGSK